MLNVNTPAPEAETVVNFVELPSKYLGDDAVSGKNTVATKKKALRLKNRTVFTKKQKAKNSRRLATHELSPIIIQQTNRASKELILPGLTPNNAASMKDLTPPSVSQLPPGVEIGELTPLNHKDNKFYTFNKRVRERVVPGWIRRVYSEMWKKWKTGEVGKTDKTWYTVVEVILNDQGEVVDSRFLRMSDSFAMDTALVESFEEARTFPNPPDEMINENGEVVMRWRISVRYLARNAR